MKRNACILLLVLFIFMLTGCWNRRELRDLGIVGMVGMEHADGGTRVICELEKPERTGGGKARGGGSGSVGGGGKPVVFVSAEGASSFDAFRNATLKIDRRFFFPHIRIFVFSEELARQGLASQMDLIYRDHEMRPHAPMVIAVDASLSEVMGFAAGVEGAPSRYLLSIVQGAKNNGKAVNVRVLNFMQLYKGKGKNAVVGVIRKAKKPPIAPKQEEYELIGEGSAVFLKDKLVGFLDGEETRGYNWVTGNLKSAIVVSQSSDGKRRNAVEVFRAENKLAVEFVGDAVKMKAELVVTVAEGEEMSAADLTDSAVLAAIEASTAQVIKQEMENTLRKVQRYRTDVFGFGQVVHQKYPQKWKELQDNWDETFAEAEIEVAVQVKVMRNGKSETLIIR